MIKQLLNEEHIGSEGFESVLLSPLMFSTFLILLYFLFIVLTYISYNNVANSIAQELNMRQTGYREAINNYPNAPKILTYKNSNSKEMPNSALLSSSNILVSPETQALKSGTYFALDKHKNQFIIPFSEIEKIEVISTKTIEPSMGRGMAGAIIKVKIGYTTTTLGRTGRSFIPMTAIGYGVIA